jgi:hypothetical protein
MMVIKHLDNNTKHPKVLLCYNFVNGIIDEEKDMLLAAKPNSFTIGTIILAKSKILAVWWPMQKLVLIQNQYRGTNFLFPSHTRKNFNRHYTNTNQNARHEDHKVESIKGGPNSPFEFGYSQRTQLVKLNINLDSLVATIIEQLLKEYKDIFVWTYKDLRGIPPHLAQH